MFRKAHKIDDDATVVFFNPGNTSKEVEFSFEPARKGVEEFHLKYSSPTSLSPIAKPASKFHTIISVDSGSEAEATLNELLSKRQWKGAYTLVSNKNNQHIDAMAASDFGISYDGQLVGQAVACHLPTMILLDMRMHHQWYHDLFNRWANNMNLIADKDIYPELIGGEAWFGKICDTLGNWYLTPNKRYDFISQWEYFVKESLPRSDGSQPNSRHFGEIQYSDGLQYEEFADPITTATQKVWESIQGHGSNNNKLTDGGRRRSSRSTADFAR